MTKKGIAISVACLLFLGLLVFLVWSTVLYFQQKDDYNGAWQEGYDTGVSAKNEYEKTIQQLQADKLSLSTELADTKASVESLTSTNTAYSSQIQQLTTQKSELEKTVSELTSANTENELTIQTLSAQVSSYETQITNLQAEITSNNKTISALNAQIAELDDQIAELEDTAEDNTETIIELTEQKTGLENQVTNLTAQVSAKTNEINTLNSTITSLNNLVAKLQSTNELQSQTITNLNTQIVSLNTQISNLTLQINNNSGIVSNLQAKITQLQNSIAYYEEYIAGLESGEQIVITAEFNGSVYNVQVINKGGKLSIIEPTSTDYVIFNYWTVDGEQIDLNTYTFNESTKIVANCTYKYDAAYYVDNSPVSEQIIVSNGYATDPTEPTKDGYEFDGWSLDGTTVIDTSDYAITKNTIFYAVFTKLHTVQFSDGENIVSTQTVRNGDYADADSVSVSSTEYKVFNGWTFGGSVVDVDSYIISADIVFVAGYVYKYDVSFTVDGSPVSSQIVANGNYATEPDTPTKTGYTFKGWSLNGTDIVTVSSTPITAETTFIALWTINSYTVTFNDGTTTTTQQVNYNSCAIEPVQPIKLGYTFGGWSLDGVNPVVVTDYVITSEVAFTALWTINSYTVTFNDGITTTTQEINYNCYAVEPDEPTKTGYTFKGWSLNGTDIVTVSSTPITAETTFIAVWEQITYTVTYYDSDKITVLDSDVVPYGEYTSTTVSPNKENRKFMGWSADGVNVLSDYNSTAVYSTKSYYAVYGHELAGLYYCEDNSLYLGITANAFVIGYKIEQNEIVSSTLYLPISYDCGTTFALKNSITNNSVTVSGTSLIVEVGENSYIYVFVGDFSDYSYIAAGTYHTEGTQLIGGSYSYDYVIYDNMTYFDTGTNKTESYVLFNGAFYYVSTQLATETVSKLNNFVLTDSGFTLNGKTFTKVS